MLQNFQRTNYETSLRVRALAELELRRREKEKKLSFDDWLKVVTPSFNWNWRHLKFIRKELNLITSKEIKKLMLFMPPRHGKSEQVTVRYAGWFLENDPSQRVILGAYNSTLAEKFSRKIRRIVQSRIELNKERKSVAEWETQAEGGLRAAGVGVGVTGMGANLIIIDDPVKNREEANSEAYREKTWSWYCDDLYTRLEPNASIILIQTRWHEDDLAGRILASEDGPNWRVINLPAIAELNDPLGRLEGEALCPERYDLKALAEIKLVMGASFQALYQQRPSAIEGEIFLREWWQFYRDVPYLEKVVQSWDTAFKDKQENDYSVCTTWGIAKNAFYLLHVWKGKVQFPELKNVSKLLADNFKPDEILIEDKASGQSLIQELNRETRYAIRAIKVDRDKIARANASTPIISAGKVFLPENSTWFGTNTLDFIDTLASFPNAAHDDEVDSTTQFILNQNLRPQSFFDSI